MPCPWLKNNRCTSPKLERPSAAVVTERCFRNDPEIYRGCEYYVDPPGDRKRDLTGYMDKGRRLELEKASFLAMIHALPAPMESGCPYFLYVEKGAYHAAYCRALNRFLGRHEVWRCVKHWRTCPIAKMHKTIIGEEPEEK